MDYLKQRQKIKRRLYSRTTRIILLILLLLLIRPTWNIYKKSKESEENLLKAKQELAYLESRQKEISQDIEYIKSEHGQDQEIRDKFGVVKEGETMVVLVKEKNTEPVNTEEPEKSWIKRTWSKFISWF